MTTPAPRSVGILIMAIAMLVVAMGALVTTLLLQTPTPSASDWYIGYADGAEPRLVDPYDPRAGLVILLARLSTGILFALAIVNLVLVLRRRRVTTSG